jgi:hypothetical protein
MRVAVFSLYATAPDAAFGTDLEIIERHLEAEDEVTVFVCQAELSACDRNPTHNLKHCIGCMGRSHRGLGLLRQQVNLIPVSYLPGWAEDTDAWQVDNYENTDELQQWQVGAFDVGSAIVSSLISWKRHATVDLKEHSGVLQKFADASLRLYRGVEEWLSTNEVDRVYVFNGRYAPMRAVLRACQAQGVDVYTHDRGCSLQHYALWKNTLPHDRELFRKNVESAWISADKKPRTQIAAEWYQSRASGEPVGAWISFVSEQSQEELPANWDTVSGRRICVFTSSEHEFAAVGAEWKNELFDSQLDGLQWVISGLESQLVNENIHLFVRVHPNQGNAHHSEEDQLLALGSSNVTVIPSRSSVSTYRLMKESDTVLTFGSSTGIEAAFWGTPSILAGKSYYRDLGATYVAKSRDDLLRLLQTDLESKGKEGALKYAYYLATYGTKFKHFQATGIRYGKFKGRDLENFQEAHRLKVESDRLKASHDSVEKAPARIRKRLLGIRKLWRR